MNPSIFDQLAKHLVNSLPEQCHAFKDSLEHSFHSILLNQFKQLHLVTRDEFEIQTRVLAKTRQKLENLEKQLEALAKKE